MCVAYVSNVHIEQTERSIVLPVTLTIEKPTSFYLNVRRRHQPSLVLEAAVDFSGIGKLLAKTAAITDRFTLAWL